MQARVTKAAWTSVLSSVTTKLLLLHHPRSQGKYIRRCHCSHFHNETVQA